MKEELIELKYGRQTAIVPRRKIREFANYLEIYRMYTPMNVERHIRMMFEGNSLAVQEFLQWYKTNK